MLTSLLWTTPKQDYEVNYTCDVAVADSNTDAKQY